MQGTTQLIVMYLLYPYGIRQMIIVYVCINTAWLLIWHWLVFEASFRQTKCLMR